MKHVGIRIERTPSPPSLSSASHFREFFGLVPTFIPTPSSNLSRRVALNRRRLPGAPQIGKSMGLGHKGLVPTIAPATRKFREFTLR